MARHRHRRHGSERIVLVSPRAAGASVPILDNCVPFHELEMAHWILQFCMDLIKPFIATHRVMRRISLSDYGHLEFDDVRMSVVLRMEIIC